TAMIDATISEIAATTSIGRNVSSAGGGKIPIACHAVQLLSETISLPEAFCAKPCNASATAPKAKPAIAIRAPPPICQRLDNRSHAVAAKIANALHMLIE